MDGRWRQTGRPTKVISDDAVPLMLSAQQVKILFILLLQELLCKYTILKVSEKVGANLEQPEAEVQ